MPLDEKCVGDGENGNAGLPVFIHPPSTIRAMADLGTVIELD
jgi:hypothetical protein